MKAFVCHYSKLVERRSYLEKKLPEMGFTDIEWVTEKDITTYDFKHVYDASPKQLERRNATSFSRYGVKKQRELRPPEIELTLQHFEIYRRISEQKEPMAVIFEDDVIFNKKFIRLFPLYLTELPVDWDVFYFGRGCGGHRAPMTIKERIANISGKKHIFKNAKCQSRFTDSYMVSPEAANRILSCCFPFHLPIDWELNYLQLFLNLNIYWSEPTLTFQGSKSGAYSSSLKQT